MGRKVRKKRAITQSENIKIDSNENIEELLPFSPQAELDYHDFGILDFFDIEKILFEFLEDCHVAGIRYALVITGKGMVVRPTVEKLLKNHQFVEKFKRAGYFTGQGGAFEVILS